MSKEPQQQGCSLVNLAGCVCIPIGIYLGASFGDQVAGVTGSIVGGLVGAIAGVPATILLVVALVSLAHAEIVLSRLLRRIFHIPEQ